MKKKKPQAGVEVEAREQALLEIFERLDKMPHAELVRIEDAFNQYEWPEGVPDKPEGWETMSLSDRHRWTGPIIQYITMRVGDKAMLRHYHKTEFGKTDPEFEDWWDSYSLRSLREQQKEFYNRYDRGCRSDHKRYYRGLFVEAILFFALGLLTAFFLR